MRFHAILDDDVGVYSEDRHGKPVYNFSYVDQIYDGLLANGVRPFVELSFMPRRSHHADVRHTFWYHPVVSPPKDYRRWDALIEALARHLVERYGIDEVSQWYFEVWNEPNLDFWAGSPRQRPTGALRSHGPGAQAGGRGLRVGGPATAAAGSRTSSALAQHIPVDFISTHVYGDDTAEDVFASHEGSRRWTTGSAGQIAGCTERVAFPGRPDCRS